MAVPMIFVRGTNYEVGYQIGQTFKSRIQDAFDLPALKREDTPKRREVYSTYLEIAKTVYPQYIEELQGLSEGAEIPFEYLFLGCIGTELTALSGEPPFEESLHSGEGCTDLILNSEQQCILAHSEDTTLDVSKGYVIQAHILPSKSNPREERFTAYCNPGTLPGNTFGVNTHGLVVTGNVIFQKGITSYNSIPRRFMSRALLSAHSLEDVVEIIKKPPGIASAYNANIAVTNTDTDGAKIYSIEIGHSENGSLVDVQQYTDIFSYHLNHLKRLDTDHYTDESSLHRAQRIQQLSIPRNMEDILEIMSDTTHETYPIFRNGVHPDPYATASIGVFDFKKNTLSVYMGNPKRSNFEPGVVVNLQGYVQSNQRV